MRRGTFLALALLGLTTTALLGGPALGRGARGPVRLTIAECEAIVGAYGCPTKFCKCMFSFPCSGAGTIPCPISTTCVDDGFGGCMKAVLNTRAACNQEDQAHPDGCQETAVAGSTCAIKQVSSPVQGPDCTYPAPNNCAGQSIPCGATLTTCKDN